jgi:hypothetical protein
MYLYYMNVFLEKTTSSAVILVLAIVTLVVYWPVRNIYFGLGCFFDATSMTKKNPDLF